MSRIYLGGEGAPIPQIALPDPNIGDSAPIFLVLANGQTFDKADYISLGFTGYEVWCVGAAGGRGSQGGGRIVTTPEDLRSGGVIWKETIITERYSDAMWQTVLKSYDYVAAESGVTGYSVEINGRPTWLTVHQFAEYVNPNHLNTITVYSDPVLALAPMYGGAGGGGGLHVVSGLLVDLPDSVLVAIGQAGADAPPGQIQSNGPWDPVPPPWPPDPLYWNGTYYYDDAVLLNASERWPSVHPTLPKPVAGGDGGASSFGAIAKASGGKGGGPSITWPGNVRTFTGKGGDGGLGGRTTAGGGGLGSSSDASGEDGSWDGTIGGGGGGGRGMNASTGVANVNPKANSTKGGKGSFSYGDTSVYGVQQNVQLVGSDVIPGGGGGARLPGSRQFGSHAPGFDPNGFVGIRLYTTT